MAGCDLLFEGPSLKRQWLVVLTFIFTDPRTQPDSVRLVISRQHGRFWRMLNCWRWRGGLGEGSFGIRCCQYRWCRIWRRAVGRSKKGIARWRVGSTRIEWLIR